jgi:hypothetical protein
VVRCRDEEMGDKKRWMSLFKRENVPMMEEGELAGERKNVRKREIDRHTQFTKQLHNPTQKDNLVMIL